MAKPTHPNRLLLNKLLVVIVVMFGFGFMLVPFYEKICEVTGINGTRTNTQIDRSRWVTVEFLASTNQKMPWDFKPLKTSIKVHPGEMAQVVYSASNTTGQIITGQAVPSYSPALAGRYFKKLECFCFSQQTLKPGEVKQMPVQFVVAPDLPRDVKNIALSYTFFEIAKQAGSGTVKLKGA